MRFPCPYSPSGKVAKYALMSWGVEQLNHFTTQDNVDEVGCRELWPLSQRHHLRLQSRMNRNFVTLVPYTIENFNQNQVYLDRQEYAKETPFKLCLEVLGNDFTYCSGPSMDLNPFEWYFASFLRLVCGGTGLCLT